METCKINQDPLNTSNKSQNYIVHDKPILVEISDDSDLHSAPAQKLIERVFLLSGNGQQFRQRRN